MADPGMRTQSGRDAVVSQLFLAHHRRLVGLASVFVDDHEAAEEIARDAFLTLYRRGRLLRDLSAAVAHLDRCVVDDGRRHLRRERSHSAHVPRVAVLAGAVGLSDADLTWRAICALPRRQREVVVLRLHVGQTDREIAATLGASRGSVETHASRAMLALAGTADAHLVARALTDRAEHAMARTDTESELREVLGRGTEVTTYRRRRWAVGGLVAVALAVSGAAVWPTSDQPDLPDPDVPVRPHRPMNADEQRASDFVSAYFSYDRRLAASYVAHGVVPALRRDLGERGWLRQNRLDQALGSVFHLDGCFQIATVRPDGARVGCLYTVNILGLGDVGYGPFSGNLFAVTVRGATVTDFFTAIGANDYDEEAWGPFQSWVEDTHPHEVDALAALDEPALTPKEVARSIRVWRQVAREYGEALRSGEAP